MTIANTPITDQEALDFHTQGQPGKVAIQPTKPLITQRDLALGYSPGVAVPCQKIHENPDLAYDYTARGNFVAVISNGTAVLGLGNLGALACKPVMEGKAILFKRFADIDAVDIEVDTRDVDTFVNAIKVLGPSWGGINLEDIAAPDCFVIEQRLKEAMDIPVFHDDQHGTAIICAAGLINAAQITGRSFESMRVVVNGAGSAGIACLELIKRIGVPHENVILCDRQGVVYEGRTDDMNQWKSAHAVKTERRTLKEALQGADVFLGLSVAGCVSKEMVAGMADKPIIFAMANPIPEIMPEDVRDIRPDAIIATGRSDYPNQVNNVMGFPYIFRGALDVRAREINEEMKIAAAQALADLARADVPDEVLAAYSGRSMEFGPDYIIPTPFDPRLISTIPVAVAEAAIRTGVARKPITDIEGYKVQLSARLDPTANTMNRLYEKVRQNPKRVIFAEGEEEKIIRAAIHWRDNGYGTPILVGRLERVRQTMDRLGCVNQQGIEIVNAKLSPHVDEYVDYLYGRLQRQGFLYRDVVHMVKNDRNTFASCMLACGHGDALISGLTRNYTRTLDTIRRVIDKKPEGVLFGASIFIMKTRTIFISDTTVHELPSSEELANITEETAHLARRYGHEPRAALLSFSTFGNPMREKSLRIRDAVSILDSRNVDFEYDGEMSSDVALNAELMRLYPFCRLSGPANVLIMPALHSANITSGLLQELGDGAMVGPLLVGMSRPVQLVQMSANVSDIISMAAIAAIEAIEEENANAVVAA